MKNQRKNTCPLGNLFSQISKQWVLHILHNISQGVESFSELKKNLKGISSRTLSERLKDLQSFGFIERKVTSETPVKIRYILSKKGESFALQLKNLENWMKGWEKTKNVLEK